MEKWKYRYDFNQALGKKNPNLALNNLYEVDMSFNKTKV